MSLDYKLPPRITSCGMAPWLIGGPRERNTVVVVWETQQISFGNISILLCLRVSNTINMSMVSLEKMRTRTSFFENNFPQNESNKRNKSPPVLDLLLCGCSIVLLLIDIRRPDISIANPISHRTKLRSRQRAHRLCPSSTSSLAATLRAPAGRNQPCPSLHCCSLKYLFWKLLLPRRLLGPGYP